MNRSSDAAVALLKRTYAAFNARDIDAAEVRPGPGERLDIVLVALLVVLGVALFVYLAYAVISR